MLKVGDIVTVKSCGDTWEGVISSIDINSANIDDSQVWSKNWLLNGKSDGNGWMYYRDCVLNKNSFAISMFLSHLENDEILKE